MPCMPYPAGVCCRNIRHSCDKEFSAEVQGEGTHEDEHTARTCILATRGTAQFAWNVDSVSM